MTSKTGLNTSSVTLSTKMMLCALVSVSRTNIHVTKYFQIRYIWPYLFYSTRKPGKPKTKVNAALPKRSNVLDLAVNNGAIYAGTDMTFPE